MGHAKMRFQSYSKLHKVLIIWRDCIAYSSRTGKYSNQNPAKLLKEMCLKWIWYISAAKDTHFPC